MARRAAWLLVVLACGCSGRKGTYVVAPDGAPPEAGPEGGSGGATDASTDASTDGGEGGVTPACIGACATALSVGCASDEMNQCLLACGDTRDQFPACASEYDAFNTCAAAEPASHYYCDTDGFATLDASYCAAEKSAFQSCVHTQ